MKKNKDTLTFYIDAQEMSDGNVKYTISDFIKDDVKKFSIIIPFFNKWNLTNERLRELYQFAPSGNTEIILVDDASTENYYKSGVEWWKSTMVGHPISVIRNKENYGFGISMNEGAKAATGEILVFLSNDVSIFGNIFDKIEGLLRKDSTALLGGEVIWWAAGWNEFTVNDTQIVVPYANGWLLACMNDVWKTMDGFDPIYGKYDYEDVDLSTQFLEKGYNIIGLNSNFVRHYGGATISSLGVDRLSHTKINRDVYLTKWKDRLPNFGKLEQPRNGKTYYV